MLPTSVINMPPNPSAPVSLPGKILRILLVLSLVFVAASLGAGVVVFLAFAVGQVLVHLLPFTIFEATLLALLALVVFATAVTKIIESFLRLPRLVTPPEEDAYDEDDAEDEAPEPPPAATRTVFDVRPAPASAPIDAAPRRVRRSFQKRR